jgi:hypothetical protein
MVGSYRSYKPPQMDPLLKKYTAGQVLYDYIRGQQIEDSIGDYLRLAMPVRLY